MVSQPPPRHDLPTNAGEERGLQVIQATPAFRRLLWNAAKLINPKCKLSSVDGIEFEQDSDCFVNFLADFDSCYAQCYCLDLLKGTVSSHRESGRRIKTVKLPMWHDKGGSK